MGTFKHVMNEKNIGNDTIIVSILLKEIVRIEIHLNQTLLILIWKTFS